MKGRGTGKRWIRQTLSEWRWVAQLVERGKPGGGQTGMQVEVLSWVLILRSHKFLTFMGADSCRKYAQNREISLRYHISKNLLTGLNILVAHLYISSGVRCGWYRHNNIWR